MIVDPEFINGTQSLINSSINGIVTHLEELLNHNDFAVGAVIASFTGVGLWLARSLPMKVWGFIVRHTVTTLEVNNHDDVFYDICKLLYERGIVKHSRRIKAGNGKWGEGDITKSIGYGTQLFWYDWHMPLLISVNMHEESITEKFKESISIQKFGRSHKFFNDMLAEIATMDEDKHKTKYYRLRDYGSKQLVSTQKKRHFDNLILPENVRNSITNGIDKFINSEQWFADHGIPYQLGILLHGPPGTGKTSIVKAIAAYMDKSLLFVDQYNALVDACLLDKESIIVVEEVDTLGIANRDKDDKETKETDQTREPSSAKDVLNKVLNALDGAIVNEGRIVIFTTNYVENLDSALIRPGRIDINVLVDYMKKPEFERFVQSFMGKEFRLSDGFELRDKTTPAEVQTDILFGLTAEQLVQKYGQ